MAIVEWDAEIFMSDMQAVAALIDSPTRLAVIETHTPQALIDWLRQQLKTTGQASYVWTPRQGLQRISIEHIAIPQTDRPAEVLDHILSSHHYGIYVLCEFQTALRERVVLDKLQRLLSDPAVDNKLVLLLGEHYQLPPALATGAARLALP